MRVRGMLTGQILLPGWSFGSFWDQRGPQRDMLRPASRRVSRRMTTHLQSRHHTASARAPLEQCKPGCRLSIWAVSPAHWTASTAKLRCLCCITEKLAALPVLGNDAGIYTVQSSRHQLDHAAADALRCPHLRVAKVTNLQSWCRAPVQHWKKHQNTPSAMKDWTVGRQIRK